MNAELKSQIENARKVLDETHVEMGGTGKTITQLEADLAAMRAERLDYFMNELWNAISALIERVNALEEELRALREQMSYTGEE